MLKEVSPGAMCSQHPDGELATFPDVVLVKLRTNLKWIGRFSKSGIPHANRDFEKSDAKHVEEAAKASRDAFRYRQIADSGVPVFGGSKKGVQYLTLAGLPDDLKFAGYKLVDLHTETARGGRMNVLLLSFERQGSSVSVTFEALRFLQQSKWEHIHVWANPPNGDGRVSHTVNAAHRMERKEGDALLRFHNGLWGF